MSKERAGTLTKRVRRNWVEALGDTPNFRDLSQVELKNIADTWLDMIKHCLEHRISLSFKPVGHLVVVERKARPVRNPNGKMCQVEAGWTVRMRQLSSDGEYWKRPSMCKYMEAHCPDLNRKQAEAVHRAWVAFLQSLIDDFARLEVRGLGSFIPVEREKREMYNHHRGEKVSVAPKKALSFRPFDGLVRSIN